MNICFERRTERPDLHGRCVIRLVATFDNQRLRFGTGEKCVAAEWNEKTGWFRKSFADIDNAALRLRALRKLVEDAYSELRTKLGGAVAGPALRAAVAAVDAPAALSPGVVELLDEHRAVLVSRGFRANTIKGYKTTRNTIARWVATLPAGMTVADYDLPAHDGLQAWMRQENGHSQNTIAGVVKQLKPFLSWARDERSQVLRIDPSKLAVEWEDVEKCWLSAEELEQIARVLLPNNLALVRDAFVFCCYTGLRYSDLHDLHAGNVYDWDGGKVLRLTQTKTCTGVSIYLTPPALALLAKYDGTRARLLPVFENAVMNRYLKRIARLAGIERMVEVVETVAGRVMKRPVVKWELVTMHTARHTFATQSLMRGMPIEVLQKVLGHANIKTTLIYAKVVEDFQHITMRRVWEGEAVAVVPAAGPVCAVEVA